MRAVGGTGRGWAVALVLAALAGAAGTFFQDLRRTTALFLSQEARELRWVVFLKDHADRAFVEEKIRALPGLKDLRFVSKDDALVRAKADPVLAEGLTLTNRNPFPAFFEGSWDVRFLREDYLTPAADRLETVDGVQRVAFDKSRVRRVTLLSRWNAQLRWILALTLGVFAALTALGAGWFLLFTSAPVPAARWGASLAVGALGGALGTALARPWTLFWDWRSTPAAALLGFFMVLFESMFDRRAT